MKLSATKVTKDLKVIGGLLVEALEVLIAYKILNVM